MNSSGYFIRKDPRVGIIQVWEVGDALAVRVGVSNALNGAGTFFRSEPGERIWDAMRRQAPSWFDDEQEFWFALSLQPGQYYGRIARPIDQYPDEAPGWSPSAFADTNSIAMSRGQLLTLARQLDRVCQTVHPSDENFGVFGHDIRNLLVLACIEVESQWRGVLQANGLKRDRYTTKDYVRLQAAMRLDEYTVSFPTYPWISPLRPFEGWGSTGQPTKELQWYDAYNAAKHNHEHEFNKATLRRALEAVSASVVLLSAQYGQAFGLGQATELTKFFHLASTPTWPPSEIYTYPYEGHSAGAWTQCNFPF
jgi:hypothetical protein